MAFIFSAHAHDVGVCMNGEAGGGAEENLARPWSEYRVYSHLLHADSLLEEEEVQEQWLVVGQPGQALQAPASQW